MNYIVLVSITMVFALTTYGKPTASDSPNLSSYGQTIKPDHNVPEKHRK